MAEIAEKRTENSKVFDLGGRKRRVVSYVAPIHYRNNYGDDSEVWKDIDLTFLDGKITKAPYDLTIEGKKATFRNKKTGEVSTIELIGVMPVGIPFEIVPFNVGVAFRHTLPSDKVPFEAQFRVSGRNPLFTRVYDDEGELELETTFKDGILTEKLSQIKDVSTGAVRAATGSIRVDPTVYVAAGADDAWERQTGTFNGTGTSIQTRSHTDATLTYAGGYRFTGLGAVHGASSIDTMVFSGVGFAGGRNANFDIHAHDVDDSPNFTTLAKVYYATDRPRTTASVFWSVTNASLSLTLYNASPDISAVGTELLNSGFFASGVVTIIFFPRSDADYTNLFKAFEHTDNQPAELVVTYTAAGGTILPQMMAHHGG